MALDVWFELNDPIMPFLASTMALILMTAYEVVTTVDLHLVSTPPRLSAPFCPSGGCVVQENVRDARDAIDVCR